MPNQPLLPPPPSTSPPRGLADGVVRKRVIRMSLAVLLLAVVIWSAVSPETLAHAFTLGVAGFTIWHVVMFFVTQGRGRAR
ncbi:hypothetical protein ACI784_10225 [Geodermatophilus sp. SYSU D01186]